MPPRPKRDLYSTREALDLVLVDGLCQALSMLGPFAAVSASRAAVCVVCVCVSGEMHVSLDDALQLSTASLVYYSWFITAGSTLTIGIWSLT